ncbi:hypothetical protein [Arcticibacter eurypsychrophilus]|uniref:hypothetical protein n=1 Tax=Arcticibacter eurypsychrophilus TaxID=1434752 RepID=UPI00084D558D|nr:hypothetical protein [Arcticibacter eurypsychrophilus]
MKKSIYLVIISIIISSCSINKQIDQAKAFEKCKYSIISADSLYVANVDVSQALKSKNFDVIKSPRILLALLRKNVPFEGKVNLQIKNPSSAVAAIRQFEYKLLIKDQELANGFINQTIQVEPGGGETVVPIKINANIYNFISNRETQDAILNFLSNDGSSSEKKSILTIKIRPTLGVGNKEIKYPGYITINKEITRSILL